MRKKNSRFVFFLLAFGVVGLNANESYAARFKVLVVMSYEETFPWDEDIREGIESVLGDISMIKYFYMDTKKNIAGGEQKAKEAYSLYQAFQPDGIIAADDNAQSMFVVPYLKDKIRTPVMFCGVNAEPGKYGYPALNVSGILERYHISESIAFVKQLVPSIRRVGFLGKDSPTTTAGFNQVQKEADLYPAKYVDFKMPKTFKELTKMVEELKGKSDVLLMLTVTGIPKEDGSILEDDDGIPIVARLFGKPLIGVSEFQAKYGVLCAVINTGQEQGRTSARMLLKAMKGTPVSQIPITQNMHGKRMINVTTMKKLGIEPRPIILQGAELVRTKK
jgi:ABC-type uncharacterized transport system substrate-binding protein